MSGSPVFRSIIRDFGGEIPISQEPYQFFFLGVAYGHYQTRYQARATSKRVHRINTGIALVVPGRAVSDLLFSEKEGAMRKRQKESRERADAENIASDRVMPSRNEFEKVLRRVSKKVSVEPPQDSPARGKKGT